ncbi:MAG: hypothetical protein MUF72_02555 [Elainella sp. Prado103]|jgi:hypothetical protein|nr:hypothetical protein [Elainella sp. Prado103]
MNILRMVGDAIRYLSDGATALFSPNRDEYPNIGVQPFSGDPYSQWVSDSDSIDKPEKAK